MIRFKDAGPEIVISGCDDLGYGVEAPTRRVFQRFGSFSKDEEGHGIDLSIVRELVERLNTDVKLKVMLERVMNLL